MYLQLQHPVATTFLLQLALFQVTRRLVEVAVLCQLHTECFRGHVVLQNLEGGKDTLVRAQSNPKVRGS